MKCSAARPSTQQALLLLTIFSAFTISKDLTLIDSFSIELSILVTDVVQ